MDAWTRSRMSLNKPNIKVSQQEAICSINVATPEREIVEQPDSCMNEANECEQFIRSDDNFKYDITQPSTSTILMANENEAIDLWEEKPFIAEVSSSAQLHAPNQVDVGELENGCNEHVVSLEENSIRISNVHSMANDHQYSVCSRCFRLGVCRFNSSLKTYVCAETCYEDNCMPTRMEVERQSVNTVLLQAFRKCTFCGRSNIAEKIYLTWETMEFCCVECLNRYQILHGSFCYACRSLVTSQSLGKCALRIAFEIRQFCSSPCVAKFKRTRKFCRHCQVDLTKKGSVVYVPPDVEGANVQEYCSESCANNCKLISSGSKMPPPNVHDFCTVCNEKKQVEIQVIRHSQLISLCSDVCFKIFKYANNVKEISRCFVCMKYFPPGLPESSFCCCNGMLLYFCGKICHNIFLFATRKTVSCLWCKVKKYEYDMIKQTSALSDFSVGCVTVCSINCLNLYQNSAKASSKRNITANTILSESRAAMQKVVLPSEFPTAEMKPGIPFTVFSTATKKPPGINIKLLLKTKEIENNQAKCIEKCIMKPSEPKNCADKLIQCEPSTNDGECQTDDFLKYSPVLPIPVPIYVPFPVSIPIPVPIPVTQPCPVPVFIPIPERAFQNIMLQEKVTAVDESETRNPVVESKAKSASTVIKPRIKPKDQKGLTSSRGIELRKELLRIYREKQPETRTTDWDSLTKDERSELFKEYAHRKRREPQNHVVESKAESPNIIEEPKTQTTDEGEKVSRRKKPNSSTQVVQDSEEKSETQNPVVESKAESVSTAINLEIKPTDWQGLMSNRYPRIANRLVRMYRKKWPESQITDLYDLSENEIRELMKELVQTQKKKKEAQNHVVEWKAESPIIKRPETQTTEEAESDLSKARAEKSLLGKRTLESTANSSNSKRRRPELVTGAKPEINPIPKSLSQNDVSSMRKAKRAHGEQPVSLKPNKTHDKAPTKEDPDTSLNNRLPGEKGPAEEPTVTYFESSVANTANIPKQHQPRSCPSSTRSGVEDQLQSQSNDLYETNYVPRSDGDEDSTDEHHEDLIDKNREDWTDENYEDSNDENRDDSTYENHKDWTDENHDDWTDKNHDDWTDENQVRFGFPPPRESRLVAKPTSNHYAFQLESEKPKSRNNNPKTRSSKQRNASRSTASSQNIDHRPSRRIKETKTFSPWQPPSTHHGSSDRPTGSPSVFEKLRSLSDDIFIKARLSRDVKKAAMIHISVTTPTNLIGSLAAKWALPPKNEWWPVKRREFTFDLDHTIFVAENINCQVRFGLFPFLRGDNSSIKIKAYEVPPGHTPAFSTRRVQLGEPFIKNHVVSVDLNHQVILIRDDKWNDRWFKYEKWSKSRDPSRNVS